MTDDEEVEKAVSVSLNGEESRLIFVDHAHGEMSVSNVVIITKEYCLVIYFINFCSLVIIISLVISHRLVLTTFLCYKTHEILLAVFYILF